MHDIHARRVEERVRECALLAGDRVASVATPMDRGRLEVAGALDAVHVLGDAPPRAIREILEEVDAGGAGRL